MASEWLLSGPFQALPAFPAFSQPDQTYHLCCPRQPSSVQRSQNTHRSGAICMCDAGKTASNTLPRSMQSYPASCTIEPSRSEATNHCSSFPVALVAVRSDWDHHESEANGFGGIPARLSASPNWLALIDCSPIIPSREGFVLVACR